MKNDDVEQARLTELFSELSLRDARLEPPARVQQAVMARWAEHHAHGPSPVDTASHPASRLTSRWTQAAVGLAGIAAMLLLVAWGLESSVEVPPSQASAVQEVAPSVELAPRAAPAPVPAPDVPSRDGNEVSAAAATSVKPATTAVRSTPVDVEPFVRLLPVTEQELTGIRLARVRMRGQAAQTLGFDLRIPAPGADGFVEADVLLGEDGLARAIRFVR